MEAVTAKSVREPITEDLHDPAYLKIRDVIYQISGIYQPEEKLYLLASRCARRMTVVGARTPSEYLEHLTIRGNRDAELRLLLNEITIGETYMFRSPAQLDALRKVILPGSLPPRALWASRGCESGAQAAPPERNLTLSLCFCWKREISCSLVGLSTS